MAVRFVCPSCQQPLEIDEQWAGQSVACPYCNRVVTAPATSTWPLNDQVPVASPAGAEPDAASPTSQRSSVPLDISASATPAWALALTLAGFGFLIVATASWMRVAYPIMVEKAGPAPTVEASRDVKIAYQNKLYEVLQSGAVPMPKITVAAFVIGFICSLIGLVLGFKMIVQRQYRGRGILISLIALFCVMCQGFSTLSILSVWLRNHLIQ